MAYIPCMLHASRACYLATICLCQSYGIYFMYVAYKPLLPCNNMLMPVIWHIFHVCCIQAVLVTLQQYAYASHMAYISCMLHTSRACYLATICLCQSYGIYFMYVACKPCLLPCNNMLMPVIWHIFHVWCMQAVLVQLCGYALTCGDVVRIHSAILHEILK